jgi:RNA polymerase sigma factor (sigma-70 family)
MTADSRLHSQDSIRCAYTRAYSYHGDLGLDLDLYSITLAEVIKKHSEEDLASDRGLDVLRRFYTTDLYLSTACATLSEAGWVRFGNLYQNYIYGIAELASPSRIRAEELAHNVLTDMVLLDRSGRSRIARYDGQISLSNWLRIIVSHRARDERQLKWNSVERLESTTDVSDETGMIRIEAELRGKRYEVIIKDSFEAASQSLSERERRILVLHYEEEYSSLEIARFLGVHPSTISRQLQQILKKLRRVIVAFIYSKYGLCDSAVRECLADILENPKHSLLAVLSYSER